MQYRFTKTMGCDTPAGKTQMFQAGDIVEADAILEGCRESCLRTGDLVEHEEPAAADLPDGQSAEDESETSSRPKRKR